MIEQDIKVVVASKKTPLDECIDFAQRHSLGVEVKDFSLIEAFNSDWRKKANTTKKLLDTFTGVKSLHSIIYDYPGKWNSQIYKEVLANLSHSLEVAKIIEASTIIVHSSYFPGISIKFYEEWLKFQVDLWGQLSEIAKTSQITIAIENIIDEEPSSILNVVQGVNQNNFRVCIDFGHLNLIDSKYSLIDWIMYLKDYLHYVHLHNNNGIYDYHRALNNGNIDYNKVLETLFSLKNIPLLALEVDYIDGVSESLDFLNKAYSCKV